MSDPISATLRIRDAIADPASVPAREFRELVRVLSASRGIHAVMIDPIATAYHTAIGEGSEPAARRLVACLFRPDAVLTLRGPLVEGQAPCEAHIEQDGQLFRGTSHRASHALVSAALGRLA